MTSEMHFVDGREIRLLTAFGMELQINSDHLKCATKDFLLNKRIFLSILDVMQKPI